MTHHYVIGTYHYAYSLRGRFYSNSEANASEFLRNVDKYFLVIKANHENRLKSPDPFATGHTPVCNGRFEHANHTYPCT